MSGLLTKVEKILNAIKIVKNVDKQYSYDVESILYAFASKFLEDKDLELVKELTTIRNLERNMWIRLI